ncbi:hypothetical protein A2U01_0071443, partial [Trifolium medium]|nr:hypothetical protein [Trifolium medium]
GNAVAAAPKFHGLSSSISGDVQVSEYCSYPEAVLPCLFSPTLVSQGRKGQREGV